MLLNAPACVLQWIPNGDIPWSKQFPLSPARELATPTSIPRMEYPSNLSSAHTLISNRDPRKDRMWLSLQSADCAATIIGRSTYGETWPSPIHYLPDVR